MEDMDASVENTTRDAFALKRTSCHSRFEPATGPAVPREKSVFCRDAVSYQ